MIINEQASTINAPADKVWALFATEDGQRKTERGFVSSITFEGKGVGMIRTMRTEGHLGEGYVKEQLEHLDEDKMEIRFRIIDTGGMVPFADYTGSAKIIPAGPKACILVMRSTFVAVDMPEDQAKKISEENYRIFYDNVREIVASGNI